MARVSIIIPALNEEEAISSVLEQLRKLPIDAEIIVVDDGSSDRTRVLAEEHGARVIRHPVPAGYGKSLKDGILAASAETIVITDADGTYPIASIPELLKTFDEGYDMVVGARQGSAYRGTFLKFPARIVFKFLVEFATGRKIPDVNSGFRVFKKSFAMEHFDDLCNGFSFTTTITLVAHLTGKIVAYVPISYEKRVGSSKVRIVRDSLRTLQYITEAIARFNPIKFFLLLSFFPLLTGLIGMIWIDELSLYLGVLFSILIFSFGPIIHSVQRR